MILMYVCLYIKMIVLIFQLITYSNNSLTDIQPN
ncbi:MAG: hypothetical protein JWQ66_3347 [Mucilaginibacter sp.]|nr:hypothetical protein [Mucilaginibacter sp.]